jgi:hypothetical protein
MDEKDFKKHLQDLVRGHHHPQDHDWADTKVRPADEPVKTARGKAAKSHARKARRK